MFKIKCSNGKARNCIFETRHGKVETPFFMPVATKMTTKLIDSKDIEKMGIKTIISNAYLIYLDPGLKLVKKMGGIHKFMNFENTIFTDSGGFQMICNNFLHSKNDKGVNLRSPYNNSVEKLTPEKAMIIQESIGSDVAMCLDDLPFHGTSKKENVECLKRTHDWAKRCKESHKDKKQKIFGIIQGSIFPDLRKKSAQYIDSLDFDGIAFGGLCIGEDKKVMHRMIDICTKNTNKEKPRYLMGVGSPADIIEAVSYGVDIFDSCYPTRIARRNTAFTSKGNIDILRTVYKEDKKPLDTKCKCYVCQNYMKSYIHHLMRIKEPLGQRLMSMHNLDFLQQLIEEIRTAIKENRFNKLKKEVISAQSKR